jgi:predicted transcriptional regulator
MARPLVLIDLTEDEIGLLRDRVLVIAQRENLSHADVAALCGVSRSVVKQLLSVTHRASGETLRCIIAALPEIAEGLPVVVQNRKERNAQGR